MPETELESASQLTLYGAGSDYCTRMVLAGLIHMRYDYKFYDVESKPGFLDKYPFAKLPVVKDGNHLLFEARNIIKHYWEKRKGKLNEDVVKWLRVEEDKLNKLLFQLVSAKWLAVQPDKGVIRELEKVLDKYESRLSKNGFLAGKDYSYADLIHLPLIHYIVNYPDGKKLIEGRKNVNKWWKEISGRNNWKKALDEKAS